MMLLDCFRKCFSVVTHVVKKFIELADLLVPVRALHGIIELPKDQKFLSLFNFFFLINKFQLSILTDHLNYDSLG